MGMISAIQRGDKRTAARLISMLENCDPEASKLLHSSASLPSHAKVIGITGAPGAGKSTLTDQLAKSLLVEGNKVGIIAVDPSSPITGGAFLGDRIRMSDLNANKNVFIRSMASRGALGGISKAVSGAVRVLEIYGAEYIFIETVGIGQSEIDVARLADTVVLVVVPGMGDDIQAEKAGILEVSDIIAVNKADHEDINRTIQQLKAMLGLQIRSQPQNTIGDSLDTEIIRTIATTGEGVIELMEAIEARQKNGMPARRIADLNENSSREELVRRMVAKFESELAIFETETRALSTSDARIRNHQINDNSEIQTLFDEYIKWRRTKC